MRGLDARIVAVAFCSWMVWAGPADAAGDLEWTKTRRLSDSPLSSRTTLNFAHAVAVDGSGGAHVVWYDRPVDRGGLPTVRYRRQGGGGNWERPRELSGPEGGEYPSILATGDRVIVVWQSSGTDGRLWLRSSDDRGASWSSPLPLSDPGSVVHASVAVSRKDGEAEEAALHLVWVDSRSGIAEVYYRRSSDGGATWASEMQVSPGHHDSWTPSIAAGGGLVAIGWVDTRDGNEEEYLRVSRDGGLSWGDETRLTTDVMNSWAPSVAIAGGSVHVAWFDQRDNEFQLRDAEAMLDQAMRLVGLEPDVAPEGILVPDPVHPGRMTFYSKAFQHRVQEKSGAIGNAVHAWVEKGGDPRRVARLMGEFNRRMWIASREWELYYARSDDAGASWSEMARLTEAEGSSSRPNLVATAAGLHLVWFDDRQGESEIYYKASSDGGVSWSDDLRLTEASGASEQPMVAAGPDGKIHVAWFDERSGASDIYYRQGEPGSSR